VSVDGHLSLATFDVARTSPALNGLILDLIRALASAQGMSPAPLLAPPVRVGVACSGGCDSMALAHALCLIARHPDRCPPGEVTPLLVEPVILTVDHQLHERSHEHATGVVEFWRGLAVESHHLRADLSIIRRGRGVEEGARRARYHALEERSRALGIDLILTAHHAHDQVETLLMRLQGPVGVAGLGGIPTLRGLFLRPWLSHPQEILKRWVEEMDLPIYEDPSNVDERFLRNRLRRRTLPSLEDSFELGWAQRVHRTAQQSRAQWDGALYFVDRALDEHITLTPWSLALSWPEDQPMTELPRSAQGLIIHRMLTRSLNHLIDDERDRRRVGDHVERLRVLWSAHKRGRLELPLGLRAWGGQGHLKIYAPNRIPSPPHTLQVDGVGLYRWGPWRVELSYAEGTEGVALPALPLQWTLRRPWTGARFHPAGAGGSKRVRRLWSDRKYPPFERDTLPVLCDERDRIIWVPGCPISQPFHLESTRALEADPKHPRVQLSVSALCVDAEEAEE
jgi:tRNA(Ile)-lysidine synthase